MDDLSMSVDEEISNVFFERPHVVILGAGASLAACPSGDRYGKQLPLMLNIVEILGLADELENNKIEYKGKNFEDIYSDLVLDEKYDHLRMTLEARIKSYFSSLSLPKHPTIYDHLVLSLRSKDVIATFNWDPFLYDACARNQKKASLPYVMYLHGNVAVGFCIEDRRKGKVGTPCSKCGNIFKTSPLLYPVKQKNYNDNNFIAAEWRNLNSFLKDAYMVTIFGYGAPKTDVEAISLLKGGWGCAEERELEEIEIIDIKSEEELRSTWNDFIHTHHYITANGFYGSWIANHPRRTCEAMWNQLMECRFISENKIPRHLEFADLWNWYKPLLDIEAKNEKEGP